jgi:hypothetical protein
VFEHAGLVDHCVQVVRVIQHARGFPVGRLTARGGLLTGVLTASGGLGREIRRLIDLWAVEDLSFNGVGGQRDFETPLLHVFGLGNHFVQFADGADSVMGLLE